MFSIEAIPCLTALPLQARLGLLFLFLPISGFSQRFLSEWGQRWFSLAWTSLVSFPYLSSIPHTALHRASFFFASKTRLPLPLKGEGRGRSKLGHAGSTSSFRRRSTQWTAPPQACHRTPEELFEAFLDPCDCVLTPSHLTLFTLRWSTRY